MIAALTIIILAFAVGSPHAEAACAWVLWNEETKSGAGWRGVKWTLKEAAAPQTECKACEAGAGQAVYDAPRRNLEAHDIS